MFIAAQFPTHLLTYDSDAWRTVTVTYAGREKEMYCLLGCSVTDSAAAFRRRRGLHQPDLR